MSAEEKRRRGRQNDFIGPRRRARIIRTISQATVWHGRRGAMRITIMRSGQPTLEGQEIYFVASIFRENTHGFAGTIVEAIEKLEQLYRDRTLEVRPPKPRKQKKETPK